MPTILVALALVAASGCTKPTPNETTGNAVTDRASLTEASMNFDLENVQPFLARIAKHIESGFSDTEIKTVAEFVGNTEVEDEHEMTLSVVADGQSTPLVIRVFMDDIDAPDLYFFTSADLASEITSEYDGMCEELGI
ncbi:MAG: hypothetical protein Aurels2KO_55120 [Aureliella sp.]